MLSVFSLIHVMFSFILRNFSCKNAWCYFAKLFSLCLLLLNNVNFEFTISLCVDFSICHDSGMKIQNSVKSINLSTIQEGNLRMKNFCSFSYC